MRKARSLIAAFLVVLIQITPGPLGLRPAQAALPLAVVAVGAIIAATGVMVAGAGVYKPPTFAQANAAVDQVTGDITRKVVVARMFGEGVTAGLRGFGSQYTLDYAAAKQWIKDHASSYPVLYPAASSSDIPQGYTTSPVVGNTLKPGIYYNKLTAKTTDAFSSINASLSAWRTMWPVNSSYIWTAENQICLSTATTLGIYTYYTVTPTTGQQHSLVFTTTTGTVVDFPLSPPLDSPSAFAAAYPNTEAGQDETDRVAAENPSAVKAPPAGITPEQAKEAAKQAEAAQMQAAATTAEAAAAADPTNTALQIAAAQARSAADQATIQAQGQTVELETTPAEETETDIPYNPSALSGPYTLPAVDFGARFQTFVDAIKATSFFSLPGSIASGIPASSSSVITINGGETIGTHNFDFADMDNLWAILRSVVLTGFMFVSIRIVCLHR